MSRIRRPQSGFSLIELTVVLAISAFLLTAMASVVAGEIRIPIKIQSEAEATRQVQRATLLITEDANVAQSFTAGTSTVYGTLKWFEFSGLSPVAVSARYFWENQKVLREVTRGGDVARATVVLDPVLNFDDVAFAHVPTSWTYSASTKGWTYVEGKLTVAIKTTHDAGFEFPDTVITATLVSDLRPQTDRPVPLPGRLPPPTPPANQVNFRVVTTPTILQGTYRSGTSTDLRFDDSNFYVTRGAGSPRTVAWEATSESINYTEITSIIIEFTGQVDRSGISQSFFVFNTTEHGPSGYDPSPDESSIYPSATVDRTITFEFNAADIAFVNSVGTSTPKTVKIKMVATDPAVFDHSADKLVFKVAGTPSATFSRDYVLDTNPTVETGTFVSGDFNGLATDDTNYYITQEVGNVIQWSAVSEPITLDTISSIEVRFIGRSTSNNASIQLFIFNPANGGDGFPVTPNATTTYPSANTDVLNTLFLSSADTTYVNSLFPKEVRIRVKGTLSSPNWRLQSDLLLFRVKP